MTVTERRERLIRILTLRGRTTTRDLAQELGVSERTIMRDIDALSTARPIATLPGKHGGVYISDTYAINRLYLKDHETALLKKIVFCLEEDMICALSSHELTLLKEMITSYENPKYKKGKKT